MYDCPYFQLESLGSLCSSASWICHFVAELYMKVTANWMDPEVFLFYIAVMFHSISYGYLPKEIFWGAEEIITVVKNLLSICVAVLRSH